jgi:SHS2 domain-containing protein
MKDFESISHTADIQLRVYGKTLELLFSHALVGMFQVIEPIVSGCTKKNGRLFCARLPERHEVALQAGDREQLLVDFLSQALALSDIHNEAYLSVIIHELDDTHIKATLQGIKVEGYERVEIKAVTYHNLQIRTVDGMLQVDIVFDI